MAPTSLLRTLRRWLYLLFATTLAASPLGATWSIVAVNTRTGEVGVATATCIENDNIALFVPVLAVGRGAGATQSAVDLRARNKVIMFRALVRGSEPPDIFQELRNDGPPGLQTRQFGIVSMNGDPFTFTGSQNGAAASGRRGTQGDVKYAIQGNVLTGDAVVLGAERAFLREPGDLSQKIMAAMEAARSLGGDGRCSCRQNAPTSCGSPPASFDKSAHNACIFVARVGDTNGRCNQANGCAAGDYYLALNLFGDRNDPDPVFVLQDMYAQWRASQASRPDAVLSRVEASADSLPADGASRAEFRIRLIDIEGKPLTRGGAEVKVLPVPLEEKVVARPSTVRDLGDGTYGFEVTASRIPGRQRFEILVDDGIRRVTLFPYPELRVDPPTAFHVGRDLTAEAGARPGAVPLTLDLPDSPGAPFLVGLRRRGLWRPLSGFPPLRGRLDHQGRAEVALPVEFAPGVEAVAADLEWFALILDGGVQQLGSSSLARSSVHRAR